MSGKVYHLPKEKSDDAVFRARIEIKECTTPSQGRDGMVFVVGGRVIRVHRDIYPSIFFDMVLTWLFLSTSVSNYRPSIYDPTR